MSKAIKNKFFLRLGLRAAGALLSGMGAYWDFEEGRQYRRMEETGWEYAYYGATFLGGLSAAAILFQAPLPVMLSIMGVYALYTMILYQFSPKPIEKWLRQCYFGRHPDENWTGRQELQIFEYSSGKKAPEKAETTWQ